MKTYTLEITEVEANIIRTALLSHTDAWISRAELYKNAGDTEAQIAALDVAINANGLGIKVLEAIS